jgi:hypothetical protein
MATQAPILTQLVNALVPIVVALLGLFGSWLMTVVGSKLKSDKARTVAQHLSEVAGEVVLELQQTTVEGLKAAAADGRLSSDEVENLKALAIARVKQHIGEKGKADVLKVFGFDDEAGLDKFIATKVEASVGMTRNVVGRTLTAQIGETEKPSAPEAG